MFISEDFKLRMSFIHIPHNVLAVYRSGISSGVSSEGWVIESPQPLQQMLFVGFLICIEPRVFLLQTNTTDIWLTYA